jgi:predicted nucleic acid-binding protein
MAADRNAWIDELARRSPTALAMALERAIATHDQALERAVLVALAALGIVVVDRHTLVATIEAARGLKRRGGLR